MNIFVAKLNFDTQEDALQDAFEEFGEVSSVKIIMDKFTGKSKGYGFVEMPNDDEGQNAIDSLNDSDLDGRTIVVKKLSLEQAVVAVEVVVDMVVAAVVAAVTAVAVAVAVAATVAVAMTEDINERFLLIL